MQSGGFNFDWTTYLQLSVSGYSDGFKEADLLSKICNIIAIIATKNQSTLRVLLHGVAYSELQTQPARKGLGKTLPRSVLSAGMLLSILMKERTSLQPTSV